MINSLNNTTYESLLTIANITLHILQTQVKCLKIWSIKYTKSQVINPTRRDSSAKIKETNPQ